MAVYVIYLKGPTLRARSPFAQQLSAEKSELTERRQSVAAGRGPSISKPPASNPRAHSFARSQQQLRIPGSGTGTPITSRNNSLTGTDVRQTIRGKHSQHRAPVQELGSKEE